MGLRKFLNLSFLVMFFSCFWVRSAGEAIDLAAKISPPNKSSQPSRKVGPQEVFSDNPRFVQGEVVAFVGGGDLAAAQHSGHLEAMLSVQFQELKLRFRNFAWEGDTVFGQPRDVGFPALLSLLQRTGVQVILIQFGRLEALNGKEKLPKFVAAYEKLITELSTVTPRLILVTPLPFEKGDELLPDLSERNEDLSLYVQSIRELAKRLRLPVIDLFAELKKPAYSNKRFTDNGLQITPYGHAVLAEAFARQCSWSAVAKEMAKVNQEGVWSRPELEKLRQGIIAKNRFWFDYYRPQNWAFLGGDRITQPSSRDHRDPNKRWFPEEMKKFLPLIEQAEGRVHELTSRVVLK